MPLRVNGPSEVVPGDIYEDGFFHPCVCIGIDDSGCVWGISLIDGSYPRSADAYLGGVRRLSPQEAWEWKMKGPEAIQAEWYAEHPDMVRDPPP